MLEIVKEFHAKGAAQVQSFIQTLLAKTTRECPGRPRTTPIPPHQGVQPLLGTVEQLPTQIFVKAARAPSRLLKSKRMWSAADAGGLRAFMLSVLLPTV